MFGLCCFARYKKLLPPAADPIHDIVKARQVRNAGDNRLVGCLHTAVLADTILILMAVSLDGFGLSLAAAITSVSLHTILGASSFLGYLTLIPGMAQSISIGPTRFVQVYSVSTGQRKHPLPTTQEKTLHIDITRWSIPKSD